LDIHKGNGWIVRDNVFTDIISPSENVAEHAIHFWDNSQDNIVERNLIVNCDRGIGFGLGSSGNTGGIIRNNMIYNNGSGMFHDVGIGLESSPFSDVYNNTVHVEHLNAIEYRFEETNGGSIINNLTNKPITSRNGGSAFVDNNYENAQAFWYENIIEGDLHLQSEISEVIDQGLALEEFVLDDMDKNSRPAGLAYDIGADEFISPTGIDTTVIDELNMYVFPNPSTGSISVNNLDIFEEVYLKIKDNLSHITLATISKSTRYIP